MAEATEGYAAAAPNLIDRYNAVSASALYKPVIDLLPVLSVRVADIGAGSGRDAAWLARMGHSVLAVEPVKQLRDAGRKLYSSSRVEWIDDRIPDLIETKRRGPFNFVLLSAVWQHLNDHERPIAMRSLGQLMASDGLVVMSLRHGSSAPERIAYPADPQETVAAALNEGFKVLRQVQAPSVQPANQLNGVRWTWLALAK